MKAEFLHDLNIRLRSLAVFRALLEDPVIASLSRYLGCAEKAETSDAVSAYADFVSELYCAGSGVLARYVQSAVNDNENPYICLIGRGEQPCSEMERCVAEELKILQAVADLTPEILRGSLDWAGYLPGFHAEKVNIADNYRSRCENIGKYGYGIYAKHRMFYINPADKIVPVRSPDKIRLSSLVDYKREQKIILDNTIALLEGKSAANILLTGDAGTGKSSTVKAVANRFRKDGVRLVELRKEQLALLPVLMGEIAENPLKFILFVDDLSFAADDDGYASLKAALEGSASVKASNAVIYATSNRRHLVKETFSAREGDEIHRRDAIEELMSLSERFGLTVLFSKPNKQLYMQIVSALVQAHGIKMDENELSVRAEAFALAKGGRSARVAEQFADSLACQS